MKKYSTKKYSRKNKKSKKNINKNIRSKKLVGGGNLVPTNRKTMSYGELLNNTNKNNALTEIDLILKSSGNLIEFLSKLNNFSNKNVTKIQCSHVDEINDDYYINDSEAIYLANALKVNEKLKNLKELDISTNLISIKGAKALADALKSNKTVTNLNINSNTIGDEGAKALAYALKSNKTLTNLNINSNKIGDVGAKALADALKSNKTLTNLDISNNNISDVGAKALEDALQYNKTLTNLDISDNKITNNGKAALEQLKKNRNNLEIISMS